MLKRYLLLLFISIYTVCIAQENKSLVYIINYPYQITSETSSKIHLCLFKPDFTPAFAAAVKLEGKIVGYTDNNGVCIFDCVVSSKSSHLLTAKYSDRTGVYQLTKRFQSRLATKYNRSMERLYVYTDRGVYNPGQNILIRCIAWKFQGKYHPLVEAPITVTLEDNNNNIYSGGLFTTNDYGVGAFTIPLPVNMREGNYRLVVHYQGAREISKLRIKRFNPPVINIQHNLKSFLSKNQSNLPIKVTLSFFAGGIIRKSQLQLTVRNEYQRVIFKYKANEQKPGNYDFSLNDQQLKHLCSLLKAQEKFTIQLTATDEYGRQDAVVHDMVYTIYPYRAILETDKDSYNDGEMVQIVAKVEDLNGKSAANIPLIFQIRTLKLKQNTTDNGVATFAFQMARDTSRGTLYSAIMKTPIANCYIPLRFAPKPLNSKMFVANTSVTAEIFASFASEYVPLEKIVHIDLTDISGAIISSTVVPITKEGEQYIVRGKIIAPTWGTMLVNLYCCAQKRSEKGSISTKTVGFITEGQKITVQRRQKMTISFINLKPKVKPGEKLQVTVAVENKDQQQVCLGASLVDKAVLSLQDPLEKKPEDHFYSQKIKSIATGSDASLIWPVVDRNWGTPYRDIAYKNWGWKGPGEIHNTDK